MRLRVILPVLIAPLLFALPARADWSALSAQTDSPGTNVLSLESPFPGFQFGWQHGVTDYYDFGLRLGLDYAAFSRPDSVPYFGFTTGMVNRFKVFQKGMLAISIHGDVGLYVYAQSNLPTFFGFSLTPGGTISFTIIPKLTLSGLFDIPMAINAVTSDAAIGPFGASGAFFGIGLGFGTSAEYAFTDWFHLGLKLEFGPLWASDAGAETAFGMNVAVNAAFRL